MSDHNPQDVETKRLPFAEAAPGAIGLETMLTAGLRLVHAGELALMTLLKAMSTRAGRKSSGCPAARLRPGSPADVIVVDPDVPWVLDPAELKSKCKNTPFDEAKPKAAWCAPSSPAAPSTNMCDALLCARRSMAARRLAAIPRIGGVRAFGYLSARFRSA